MTKRKADIRIGYRAAEEALRLAGGSVTRATVLLGGERKLINNWESGDAPSVIFLQRLLEIGADIPYILSGRRSIPVEGGAVT